MSQNSEPSSADLKLWCGELGHRSILLWGTGTLSAQVLFNWWHSGLVSPLHLCLNEDEEREVLGRFWGREVQKSLPFRVLWGNKTKRHSIGLTLAFLSLAPHYRFSSLTGESRGGSYLVFIHNKMLCFPDSSTLGKISFLKHALSNHLINVGCCDHCLFFLSVLYEAALYIHPSPL